MTHYLNDAQIVRDRQRAIQTTMDSQRLAQLAQVYRPGLTGRLLAGLGALMVESGTRLKARYEAEMQMNRQDAKNAEFKVIGY